MNLTYSSAYQSLEKLVDEIEGDNIQLDTLAEKIKEAKTLIEFCENKLRVVDGEVKSALGGEDGK